MCLKIGNADYCLILRAAPHFNGISLEIWQHNLEENHGPHDPQVMMAIAEACGLSLDAYRKRTAIVRGENALAQVLSCRRNPQHIGTYGALFSFPRECQDYIRGNIHEFPDHETLWINPETAKEIFEIMSDLRFQWFRSLVAKGDRILISKIAKYPERISYLLKLRSNSRTKELYKTCLRMMNEVCPWTKPSIGDVRLTAEEIDLLVAVRSEEFLESPWHLDQYLIGQLFNADELHKFDAFVGRRRKLYKPGIKKTRFLKKSRETFQEEFIRWCKAMRGKYEEAFKIQLRQYLVESNLTIQLDTFPEVLPKAA